MLAGTAPLPLLPIRCAPPLTHDVAGALHPAARRPSALPVTSGRAALFCGLRHRCVERMIGGSGRFAALGSAHTLPMCAAWAFRCLVAKGACMAPANDSGALALALEHQGAAARASPAAHHFAGRPQGRAAAPQPGGGPAGVRGPPAGVRRPTRRPPAPLPPSGLRLWAASLGRPEGPPAWFIATTARWTWRWRWTTPMASRERDSAQPPPLPGRWRRRRESDAPPRAPRLPCRLQVLRAVRPRAGGHGILRGCDVPEGCGRRVHRAGPVCERGGRGARHRVRRPPRLWQPRAAPACSSAHVYTCTRQLRPGRGHPSRRRCHAARPAAARAPLARALPPPPHPHMPAAMPAPPPPASIRPTPSLSPVQAHPRRARVQLLG